MKNANSIAATAIAATKKTTAKTTAKKAAPKKVATKTAVQTNELNELQAHFAAQVSEREQLAAKISTTDRTSADFEAVRRAATQSQYYTFAGTVSDVLKHAVTPEKAKRNNFAKLAMICFMLDGEKPEAAQRKAAHKASTTRDAAGKPYNPQIKQAAPAMTFILDILSRGQAVDKHALKKCLDHKVETQASEWLKAFAFAGCGHWTGTELQPTGDDKKVATLAAAFKK